MRNYCFAVCEVGESKNIPVVGYMERSTNVVSTVVLYCYLFIYVLFYLYTFIYVLYLLFIVWHKSMIF